MTAVQNEGIAAALTGRDLTLRAATGTGKTLAYCIPAIQILLERTASRDEGTLVLVLIPTRDLALQVEKVLKAVCKYTQLTAAAITGGNDFKYQRALFRKNPEFIVATPGRLLDHINRGSTDLASLQVLVLDEADQMLDQGLVAEVDQIKRAVPTSASRWLYSATLASNPTEGALADFIRNPIQVQAADKIEMASGVSHAVAVCSPQERLEALENQIESQDFCRILVFCNMRKDTAELADCLSKYGRTVMLHGELSREERTLAIQTFTAGRATIMSASPVASRGLDIEGIDLVVNYDFPETAEEYLHRAGRAGRGGNKALCLSLVTTRQIKKCEIIERELGISMSGKPSANRPDHGDGSGPLRRRR